MSARYNDNGDALITETGIRCGNGGRFFRHYHPNSDTVRACYQRSQADYDQQTAELDVERRTERFYEEGF
jgi:hypothetical protein